MQSISTFLGLAKFVDFQVFPTGGNYNPIKTALLLLLHFCFNFILFGHTGHVNFDFN